MVPPTTNSRSVLLLHALAGATHESAGLELALREYGFCVATLSFERSPGRIRPSCWRWILDSVTEIDRLALIYAEINLCGIGQGAALALAIAAERPTKLDSLALISPTLRYSTWTTLRWRGLLPMPEWLSDWRVSFGRQRHPAMVKHEGVDDRQHRREPPLAAAASVISAARLREARRLISHVRGSLERVHTPTLIIHTPGDVAEVADVRHVQVHIGSQLLEVFPESGRHSTMHEGISERTVLKIVEFFNDVARRRALGVARS